MGRNNINGSTNMKRALSTTVERSFKKTKRAITKIETIPRELLSEVLARVASDSFTDIFNAKLSCKGFYDIAEDTHVYQHMSLNNFPIVAWTPITEKQQSFLTKCKECDNPELLYRQAVVNYFNDERSESTIRCLDKACKLGHIGATYAKCIVMLFSDDAEMKEKGVKLLGNMKKDRCSRRELKEGRDKLIETLSWIWVKNPHLKHRPIYCTTRDDHKTKKDWPDDVEEEGIHCQACSADEEISLISGVFPQL
ncbi:hypothetical protein BUALT_Bualt16G0102600 [Buddleja alternifolia]|uniref:F-box domain-containing protein n=1 Tax=Buddleja alternifolia TaxID=168488 RepID=A0AAV6WAJ6_9LAMI|nr:hypothetical protein BUALT_Bualt16G0102600 [Buddleja alternifolia]